MMKGIAGGYERKAFIRERLSQHLANLPTDIGNVPLRSQGPRPLNHRRYQVYPRGMFDSLGKGAHQHACSASHIEQGIVLSCTAELDQEPEGIFVGQLQRGSV